MQKEETQLVPGCKKEIRLGASKVSKGEGWPWQWTRSHLKDGSGEQIPLPVSSQVQAPKQTLPKGRIQRWKASTKNEIQTDRSSAG